MYIRKVCQTDKKTKKQYCTYRLVESVRTERGVRQRLLLNLGSKFQLHKDQWKLLANRVEEIVTQQDSLLPSTAELEQEAQYIAKQLINKKAITCDDLYRTPEKPANNWQNVDLSSLENKDVRSIGAEFITYQSMLNLQLDEKLKKLGFNSRQVNTAIATIVGRLLHPSSERETHRWLQQDSALDELLGVDFGQLSLNHLYQISDQLLANKQAIEEHLYQRECEIFKLQDTICLYDLTNTYFEGSGQYNDKAEFGRSKEKRTDCRLVTLALVLDSDGFAKRSEILPGNISEAKTLQTALSSLGLDDSLLKPTVVMDAGIATEENINYLKQENYGYIVVSRKRNQQMPVDATPVIVKQQGENKVEAILHKNKETDEYELYCYSSLRDQKEQQMLHSFEINYEEALSKLATGLTKKGSTKKHDKIVERIGRLKEKHKRISGRYDRQVNKDPESELTLSIKWQKRQDKNNAETGVYCLRTNQQHLGEKILWKTYTSLTDIEAAFRCMKSELGMRPVFHQKTKRVDGHLFITLLAYHILHSIRYPLKQKGIHHSWDSLRAQLTSQVRITTALKREDGKVLHVRKTIAPNQTQKEIYTILNLPHSPGKTYTTIS